MARDSVIVKGVELTRQDINQALVDLAKPDPIPVLSIVKVRKDGRTGIVITGPVMAGYVASRNYPQSYRYLVVMGDGTALLYPSEEGVLADFLVTGVLSDQVQANVSLDTGGGVK